MTTEELEEDTWDQELKPRERLFCLHYCTDESCFLNAKAAYKATYTKVDKETGEKIIPEDITCETNGSKLCKKPRVKLAIRKLLKITQQDLDEENTYKIINNLASLAFFNPADIIQANGSLKTMDLETLGEKAKAIAQIKPSQYGAQVTLVDRSKYMDLMLRYLNIVKPEQQIEIKLPVIEMVNKAPSVEDWNLKAEQEE